MILLRLVKHVGKANRPYNVYLETVQQLVLRPCTSLFPEDSTRLNKKFWEERRVQQCLHFSLWIRYHGNIYTDPLPSNDKGILPMDT
jgi:hypothetical protein